MPKFKLQTQTIRASDGTLHEIPSWMVEPRTKGNPSQVTVSEGFPAFEFSGSLAPVRIIRRRCKFIDSGLPTVIPKPVKVKPAKVIPIQLPELPKKQRTMKEVAPPRKFMKVNGKIYTFGPVWSKHILEFRLKPKHLEKLRAHAVFLEILTYEEAQEMTISTLMNFVGQALRNAEPLRLDSRFWG